MKIEPKLHSIDAKMHYIEGVSTRVSFIPVLGIVPGALKILTGTLQMVTALIVTILLAIPLCVIGRGLLKWTASHIAHGFGNILAGIIEAIPLIGTIYCIALLKLNDRRENDFVEGSFSDDKNSKVEYFTRKVMAYGTISQDYTHIHKTKTPIKGLLFTL